VPFSELQRSVPLPDKRPFPEQLVTIGNHLKNCRLKKGLLIKDVVKALGINRETLRAWEMGLYEPFPKQFPGIVQLLGYYPFDKEVITIGEKIKKCRLLRGLNQEEFAKLINMNRISVMNWENGTVQPTEGSLRKLRKIIKDLP
jgi:transcriptional regulator with XRE-family HTH domain